MLNVLSNLSNFSGSNYVALVLVLGAIGAQISGLKDWHDSLSPSFIGGTLLAIVAVLQGIGSKQPQGYSPGSVSSDTQSRINKLPMWFAVAVLSAGIGVSAGCATNKPIPNLPAIQATTDKDVRASIMYVYGVVGSLGNALDKASELEDTAFRAGGVPADTDKALRQRFTSIARLGKKFIQDVDSHALTDWAAIQARVNPIIDEINTLSAAAKPSGPSKWASLVQVAVDIAVMVLQPAALAGGH